MHEAARSEAVTPIVVRPHLLVRWGLVAAFAAFTAMATSEARSGDADWTTVLAAAFFGAWTIAALVSAVRERIEATAEEVRVVRQLHESVVDRHAVHHVARSAGRGRPAHLSLSPGPSAATTRWLFDLRPVARHPVSGISLPSNLVAARAARALDLPLTTFRGEPADPDAWRRDLHGWYRRPFIWSCIVLVAITVALTVWGLFFGPPA